MRERCAEARILCWSKILAYASVALFFAVASVLAIEGSRAVARDRSQGEAVLARETGKLDAVLTALLDPRTGTVHLLDKDAVDAGDLIKHTDELTFQEMRAARAWNGQIGEAFDHLNGALASLRGAGEATAKSESAVAGQAVETLRSAQDSIDQLQPLLSRAGASLDGVNRVVSDPNIPRTIANVRTTTGDLAVIATDGKNVVEKYAHPGKKKLGFWGAVWAAVQFVHKLEPPIF